MKIFIIRYFRSHKKLYCFLAICFIALLTSLNVVNIFAASLDYGMEEASLSQSLGYDLVLLHVDTLAVNTVRAFANFETLYTNGNLYIKSPNGLFDNNTIHELIHYLEENGFSGDFINYSNHRKSSTLTSEDIAFFAFVSFLLLLIGSICVTVVYSFFISRRAMQLNLLHSLGCSDKYIRRALCLEFATVAGFSIVVSLILSCVTSYVVISAFMSSRHENLIHLKFTCQPRTLLLFFTESVFVFVITFISSLLGLKEKTTSFISSKRQLYIEKIKSIPYMLGKIFASRHRPFTVTASAFGVLIMSLFVAAGCLLALIPYRQTSEYDISVFPAVEIDKETSSSFLSEFDSVRITIDGIFTENIYHNDGIVDLSDFFGLLSCVNNGPFLSGHLNIVVSEEAPQDGAILKLKKGQEYSGGNKLVIIPCYGENDLREVTVNINSIVYSDEENDNFVTVLVSRDSFIDLTGRMTIPNSLYIRLSDRSLHAETVERIKQLDTGNILEVNDIAELDMQARSMYIGLAVVVATVFIMISIVVFAAHYSICSLYYDKRLQNSVLLHGIGLPMEGIKRMYIYEHLLRYRAIVIISWLLGTLVAAIMIRETGYKYPLNVYTAIVYISVPVIWLLFASVVPVSAYRNFLKEIQNADNE